MAELPAIAGNPDSKTYVNALIRRLKAPSPGDIDAIISLPPKAKAQIALSQEFQDFLMAMAVDAALGYERMTRNQWKALHWFRAQVQRTRPLTFQPIGAIDIRPQDADFVNRNEDGDE